jgi:glycosyltransferase involved in cell wall biosynthesis
MPRVSVIISTYKRPDYLRETLRNVHQQTFKDFEVIVVDDGTPGDENEKICSEYPDVIYKKIANTGGPMVPRNTGLKIAKGEYIAFVDDDDLWVPDKLQRQVDILDNERDYGLVHGCCKIIDSSGKETGDMIGKLTNSKRKHGYVFDDMIVNFTVMMPTSFFRKELCDVAGGFNEKMHAAGEDTEFFCRLAFYTKLWFIEEPIAYYRVHDNKLSITEDFSYVYLPLELYNVIKDLKNRKLLENRRYRMLRNKLLLRQATVPKSRRAVVVALKNCLTMDSLCWIRPKIVYVLLKKYIKK